MKLHTQTVMLRGKERIRYFIDDQRCTKVQYEAALTRQTADLLTGKATVVDVVCPIVRCIKQWEELHPSPIAGVRFCESCKKSVYMCKTEDEVSLLAELGMCVAIKRQRRMHLGIPNLQPPA